jgi:hypothetical protein
VSAAHPCPICARGHWCSISTDGRLAACRRVEAGAWRTKIDKAGAPVYLHRLDGTSAPPPAPPPPPGGPGPERADADTLHQIYGALLAALPLSTAHRDNLRRRMLRDAEIDQRGYGTLPVRGRAAVARGLQDRFGDVVLRVPGVIVRDGQRGPYLTLAGAAGLVVPVRDPQGRVVAVKVRRDNSDGSRYSCLSSAKYGGPGPGSSAHVPLGVQAPAEVLRVTEGELKADLSTLLSSLPTISAPGATNWRLSLDTIKALQAKTVRLAFDADARAKRPVAQALLACAGALAAEGLAVELERWDISDGKGLDDLLAAGKQPELLKGDAAVAAVQKIAEAAGVPLPGGGRTGEIGPEEAEALLDQLARFPERIDTDFLLRDRDLMRGLVRLSIDDPLGYARARAKCKDHGVALGALDYAVKRLRAEAIRDRPPPAGTAGPYQATEAGIIHLKPTPSGPVAVSLSNFNARIVEQITVDDGAERRLTLAVQGNLADGTPLPRADVPADKFAWMRWPLESWGTRAVVSAGPGASDHLRAALQMLSGNVPTRTIYSHTGWLKEGERWYFLHAAGAIGPDGPAADIDVSLAEPLAGLALPNPPHGEDLTRAVRASLALLDGLAPDRIMFPLVAALCRAALGEAPGALDLSLHLAGPHATGKSELAALAQQHYGAGLDARHLPGSWLSTGNSLEARAFAAKDVLFAIDDWAPRGGPSDRQRLEREADRLLRAAGNRAGRGRMRADGTLRPERPPRGLILSTGEDIMGTQSLRGRMLVLEVSPGDMPLARLTPHQQAAAAGLFAQALAGFIQWLAPQYGQLCDRLPGERAALRDRALEEATGGSPRTAGIVADLSLGLKLFLDFALWAGAITADERAELARRGWKALREAAARQAEHVQAAEPCGHFVRLLRGVIASGRGHLAGPDGAAPDASPEGWGWRRVEFTTREGPDYRWEPQGRRVGWVEGLDLLLEAESAHAETMEFARHQGESMTVSCRTLAKRLKERGLLASWDRVRQRNTVRRTLEGVKDREVLHLHVGVLSLQELSEPSAGVPGGTKTPEKPDGSADGSADGLAVPPENRPPEPSAIPEENQAGGRFGRSDAGEEAPRPKTSQHRRRGVL